MKREKKAVFLKKNPSLSPQSEILMAGSRLPQFFPESLSPDWLLSLGADPMHPGAKADCLCPLQLWGRRSQSD